ncbi:MAG: tRNA-dihydrouridine synthase, partial [Candidatus Omnitrophica bacterium]|nr:tRNA-dihydrouridine synthase [Candidatus Omnitrophota bacterium]
QGYTGPARYDGIRRVKEAVSIPVIGNGDVVDGASAKRLQAVSGCEGVMLGRGALGNPWIYRQVQAALNQEAPPPLPDLAERKRVLLRHFDLQQQYEEQPLGHLRRVASWYFKDCPGVAEFRNRIHQAQSVCEMRDLIEAF